MVASDSATRCDSPTLPVVAMNARPSCWTSRVVSDVLVARSSMVWARLPSATSPAVIVPRATTASPMPAAAAAPAGPRPVTSPETALNGATVDRLLRLRLFRPSVVALRLTNRPDASRSGSARLMSLVTLRRRLLVGLIRSVPRRDRSRRM